MFFFSRVLIIWQIQKDSLENTFFIPLEEVLANGLLFYLYLAGCLGRESRTLTSILKQKGIL